MLRLRWNELIVGDRVLVHDADEPNQVLVPGVVTNVHPAAGSNEVSIRLKRDRQASSRIVAPQRLAVHTDPIGFDESCWRCSLSSGQ
jgi:hypothetical protein